MHIRRRFRPMSGGTGNSVAGLVWFAGSPGRGWGLEIELAQVWRGAAGWRGPAWRGVMGLSEKNDIRVMFLDQM